MLQNLLNLRIGQGYDIHALVENRPLILGGIHIPYEKGLMGHSDADALCHAITDALLGASNKGDIGRIFPDTSDDFKDANSIELLKKVLDMLSEYTIINIDCTIIAQKPKLSPYIQDIQQNLSKIIGSQVNVKAKTNEKFGYLGRSEAIAVDCVCLLYKN